MERVSPSASAMDVLLRWPMSLRHRTTAEIAETHGVYMQRAFGWMMRLTDKGYFTRTIIPIKTGGRAARWTITEKGRAVARELQMENA